MSDKLWDGRTERRAMNIEDHDLLLEIKGDTKHLVDTMNSHILDDKVNFKKITDEQSWHSKILYSGLGIVLFIEFIAKVLK